MLVDVWAYCQKKSKSSKLCLDEILWETLWCQLNITRLSDAHTQCAFFSEGLLSWLGSRDLLETLAFPETLNWSQKGVCCLQTSSHLLKLQETHQSLESSNCDKLCGLRVLQCHLTDRGRYSSNSNQNLNEFAVAVEKSYSAWVQK